LSSNQIPEDLFFALFIFKQLASLPMDTFRQIQALIFGETAGSHILNDVDILQ